jgi:hypothetical protein
MVFSSGVLSAYLRFLQAPQEHQRYRTDSGREFSGRALDTYVY